MEIDYKFNVTHSPTVEGYNSIITESNGYGTITSCRYTLNPEITCICNLKVEPPYRNKGLGNALMNLCENPHVSDTVMLWVEKDSWMQAWYERRGYEYHCEKDDEFIWMIKHLKRIA